ncbi:DUF148 domain-containing protein [Trichostrongylus colubriformis]|uniref:DUF148 domain-containing protein n=1 Tax=Trichostrongylus colubriformis TaxID=6319 RepID=A0AAN8G2B3_TRICO
MKLLILAILLALCAVSIDGWKRANAVSTNEEPSEDGEPETRCRCHHHCHHHYHRHKMPPFLKHVSADARWEYYAIIRNLFTSMNEKLKQVHEWAKKQGPEVEKGVDVYFKKIKDFWEDTNKNTTKVIDEMPKVYPKVYKIMSNLDLTPREIYKQIMDLHLDLTTSVSLYAVVMAVVHTGGADYPYLMDHDMFFERIATPKFRNHFYSVVN